MWLIMVADPKLQFFLILDKPNFAGELTDNLCFTPVEPKVSESISDLRKFGLEGGFKVC